MVKDKLIKLVAFEGLTGMLIFPMKKEVELKGIIELYEIHEDELKDDLKKSLDLYGPRFLELPIRTIFYDHKT